MKFTVAFVTLLSISTSWAVLAKRVEEKDKREAPVGYPSSGQSYQAPSLGHGEASAISVAAGYSIGGAKPSYNFGDFGSGAAQLQLPSEGLHQGGQATYQLAPITLQPGHGSISGNDLSQIMSQLSHSINSGALTLTPSNNVAEFHTGAEGAQGAQEISYPQFSYAAPKFQQYALSEQQGSVPSYSAGTKGLGSYGSTGPVLFNPSQAQVSQPALTYSAPSSSHSFGDASSISLGSSGGHSLGSAGGHSLGGSSGYSLGSSGGYPLGSSGGQSLGGHSLGSSGNSFGGSYKSLGASYIVPSKGSFKPSAYLGSSIQGDAGHGHSAISGSYGSPSLSGLSGGLSFGSGNHGASFGNSFGGFGSGSTKYLAPSYQSPKAEGFGSNLESVASFASNGHLASPPGTTYGFPSSSYTSNNAHAASSASPQYYVKHSSPSTFGEGSTSYRSPISSHSSLSSYSSGPKYSFGGHGPSARYSSPKDSHGAYSETSYNTIKYSEELKPRAQ